MIKKSIQISLIYFSLLLLVASPLQAQDEEGKSGTVYSKFGTGMPVLNNTAQERGMGIIGVSYSDLGSPGLSNPAVWGMGFYTRASINFDFTNYSIEDNSGEGGNSLLKISNFQAVFPLSKNKLGLSVALYPETRSSYNVNSIQNYSIGNSSNQLFTNRTGTGGVTKFEVGLGYKVNDYLFLGYAPSYSFLTERENESITFLNRSLPSNTATKRTNGTAVSHRFGLVLKKNSVFSSNDILQFGSAVSLESEFDANQTIETEKPVGSTDNQVIVQVGETKNATVSLPLKVNGGITYFPSSKFNASVEYQYENWANSKYGFSNTDENAFKDREVYGVGFQYHAHRTRASGFFSNFKYSAGVTFDTGHLSINNEDISTLWFNAGLGLISPDFRTGSSFDLSFQYGIRGSSSNSLVKENIFGINLSVNLTELMFLRRKLN
jgi:hypothetical protein